MSETKVMYKRGDIVLIRFGGRGSQVAVYLEAPKGRKVNHLVKRWHGSNGRFYPESGVKERAILGLANGDPRKAQAELAWLKELADRAKA